MKADYPADLSPLVFGAKPKKERKLDTSISQYAYQAYERGLGEAFASASSGADGKTEAYAKSND